MSHAGRHATCLIRPGAKHEIPEIERVLMAAFAQYRDEIPAAIFDAYMGNLCQLADRWDEADVLVADLDGRVAGTASFYADASSEGLGLPESWAGFRRLAVHPAMRGQGIGRMLTKKCVDTAKMFDAPTIGIHTASFLEAACRIYEQIGFRRCPEYDLRASEMLSLDEGVGDVAVIAYQLDLTPPLGKDHAA
jgi:GNAT superfamily N-acetyltransferase